MQITGILRWELKSPTPLPHVCRPWGRVFIGLFESIRNKFTRTSGIPTSIGCLILFAILIIIICVLYDGYWKKSWFEKGWQCIMALGKKTGQPWHHCTATLYSHGGSWRMASNLNHFNIINILFDLYKSLPSDRTELRINNTSKQIIRNADRNNLKPIKKNFRYKSGLKLPEPGRKKTRNHIRQHIPIVV